MKGRRMMMMMMMTTTIKMATTIMMKRKKSPAYEWKTHYVRCGTLGEQFTVETEYGKTVKG
jgi:hypothetical protein